MNEFEIVITIDRPVDAVFAFLQDFNRIPEWNPGVIEARRTSDGPFGVGSTVVYLGKFLGRSFESPSTCTEFVPHERLASKSSGGPFQIEIDNTLHSDNGGTKLTSVFRGESRGFFKLAEPVVVRLAKKQFEAAMENMKALMEAEPAVV
jgi:carbon monoxide dehydrogenase subunit G